MSKKKEILPIFQEKDQLYWKYKQYSSEEQQKVIQFLEQNQKEFEKLMTQDTFQNLNFLSDKIGVMVHPEFKKEYDSEVNFLILQNIKIDFVSIKLLNFCLKFGKIKCLKLANNDLKNDEFIAMKSLIMDNKIEILFYDFQLIKYIELLQIIGTHPNLKVLSLRGNDLNDENIQILCHSIQTNENSQISCLELYNNNFTEQGISLIYAGLQTLGKMLEFNKSIEYLGLAKNKITNMNIILEKVTRSYFNEIDFIEYKQKIAERDAIVLKNSKQKNEKLKEHVPQLQPFYIENNQGFLVKNNKLINVNFSINIIEKLNLDDLKIFFQNTNQDFKIILSHNPLEEITVQKIQTNFQRNVIF